jgi:hypothetical protein
MSANATAATRGIVYGDRELAPRLTQGVKKIPARHSQRHRNSRG